MNENSNMHGTLINLLWELYIVLQRFGKPRWKVGTVPQSHSRQMENGGEDVGATDQQDPFNFRPEPYFQKVGKSHDRFSYPGASTLRPP